MSSSYPLYTPSPTATISSTANKHNVATFAGAVGGSFGLLSCLAIGLCISIRCRRRRAALRERRHRSTFAQVFTAQDHGEYSPEEEPVMSQAQPAPFVPRYFPGSLPVSPPPYNADENRTEQPTSPGMSVNRAGMPVAIASTLPPMISLPGAALDLQRTSSNNTSTSYADRPPPTPPDEDMRISLFGSDGLREERNLNGGIVGPLPVETPSSEESDPMLSLEFADADVDDRPPHAFDGQMREESVTSRTFGTSGNSRSSRLSEPSGTAASSSYTPYSLASSSATSMSAPPGTTPKFEDAAASSVSPPTLSTSTSLPSLTVPSSSRLLSSTSSPDLTPKPTSPAGLSTFAYPLLQPSRVPLPPSLYGSDVGSQDTLERHDSRT
ncbi:uncharacterized protein FOMMEDRAFT_154212 [Fomitiporia mediterranea MF3/22]|uniref:uncharacterized protein n=1 Tax=Fomitiporia mediterranea (strain MF3/22) TaxID=694068 RepID=UPI000440898D|nr:uncharacterized protein FOMMEDRAFT_154212 [Fomitiporia mediterranea MF3/22]EJD05045.1 hypothetical protein FOMMEDRAFT_154212 [Fomitiporia mediterranea MF3/22]